MPSQIDYCSWNLLIYLRSSYQRYSPSSKAKLAIGLGTRERRINYYYLVSLIEMAMWWWRRTKAYRREDERWFAMIVFIMSSSQLLRWLVSCQDAGLYWAVGTTGEVIPRELDTRGTLLS